MSVTDLPRSSVSVWPPVWYEPPTMPTSAVPLPNETRRKTGAPDGNVPSLPTRCVLPLTEIATVSVGAAVVVVVVVPPAGVVDGVTVAPGVVVGVVGAVVGLSAVGASAAVGGVAPPAEAGTTEPL